MTIVLYCLFSVVNMISDVINDQEHNMIDQVMQMIAEINIHIKNNLVYLDRKAENASDSKSIK